MNMHGAKRLWGLLISIVVFAFPPAYADVITDWNVTTMEASAQANSAVQSRALAITHAAVFDAVNAIAGKYQAYMVEVKAPAGASQEAAASTAAHTVLRWLFPAQQGMLDAALTRAVLTRMYGMHKPFSGSY